MKRPAYFIVGNRPVKTIDTDKSEVDILAFNWKTGEFETDFEYLDRLYLDHWEVEQISEEEFEKYVEDLRAKLREKKAS